MKAEKITAWREPFGLADRPAAKRAWTPPAFQQIEMTDELLEKIGRVNPEFVIAAKKILNARR